jgi:hypothetical protein
MEKAEFVGNHTLLVSDSSTRKASLYWIPRWVDQVNITLNGQTKTFWNEDPYRKKSPDGSIRAVSLDLLPVSTTKMGYSHEDLNQLRRIEIEYIDVVPFSLN